MAALRRLAVVVARPEESPADHWIVMRGPLIEEVFDVVLPLFGLSIAMGKYWMRNHVGFRRF